MTDQDRTIPKRSKRPCSAHIQPRTVSEVESVYRNDKGKAIGLIGIARDITERKRAEEALRISEERFRDLFENANDIIYTHDLQGNYTSVNRAGPKITGYTHEEALRMNIADIIAPEYLEQARQRIAEKVAGVASSTGYELEIIAKDSSRVALEIKSRLILQDGVIVGIQGIARDITERKRAEVALRLSEERFRMFSEESSEGIVIHDNGLILDANKAAAKMYGYELSEVIGMPPLLEFVAPESRDLARKNMRAKYEGTYEVMGLRKDGTVFPVEITSKTFSYKGRETRLILFRDITERKRAEEALRLSEERFAKAFHANPEPISIIRYSDSIILEINDRWESVFGYTRKEVIGRTAAELNLYVNPDDRLKLRDLFKEQGFLRQQEADCLSKSGDMRHISMSAEQIVINDEPCIIFLMRDITARQRAEEALIESEEQNRAILRALPDLMFLQTDDGVFLDFHARDQRELYSTPEAFLGKNMRGVLPPDLVENLFRCFRRAKESDEPQVVEFTLPVQGEERYYEARVVRSSRDKILSIVRNITERKRAEEELRDSEESYRRFVELSPDTILVVSEGKIDFINSAGVELFGATSPEQIVGMPFLDLVHPNFHGLVKERAGQTLEGKRIRLMEQKHVRLDGKIINTEVKGIGITYRGKQAAQVIIRDITERVRAREARIQLQLRLLAAQEEERRRISRELHDQMGQHLPALMLGLKALKDRAQGGPLAVERLQQLQDLAERIARDAHTLARELRPAALDDFGLHIALSNYMEDWSTNYGIAVDFHSAGFDKDERLPPHIEITLYRTVQEALTNVSKHAEAKHVSLILERSRGVVLAVVEDDGKGFDVDAVMDTPISERRLGLLGMQERVELVSGTLEIESVPGAGTTIAARIPISRR